MRKCPRGLEIQSVIFKSDQWTAKAARGWLLAHHFKAPAVDRTKTELRYRQRQPTDFTKGSFKRIDLEKKKGIFAIVACPKRGKESDKSKRKSSPKAKRNPRFKFPGIVVQHGRCVELVVDVGGDQIAKYRWRKTGKGSQWLLTDGPGRRLFICEYNKVAVTNDDFNDRVALLRSAERVKAISQWMIQTRKQPDAGSIIKVPERTLKKIGRAVSITYYFDLKHKDGAPREHVFESAPLVKADSFNNPKLVVISGGDLVVTRAGIEG